MVDIVERLRRMVCYASTNSEWPNVLLEEAADEIERLRSILEDRHMAEMVKDAEIERLREEAGYAKLMYDKHMAEKLTRAEAVIEAMRTHKQLHNPFVQDALATYEEKER